MRGEPGGAVAAFVSAITPTMEVLSVTIFLSLMLAVFFVALFFFSHRESQSGLDQESLLPLDDGPPKVTPPVVNK